MSTINVVDTMLAADNWISNEVGLDAYKANAATWLVLRPMDVKEAKKNAPNVHMDPDSLTSLKGRGDGYLRDRSSARAKRIQVRPLPSEGPKE